MTTDYTFIGMLVVTCVSAFSSVLSTISAQTNNIGTYSLSSSSTASSGVLGLLPELVLLVGCCLGVVGMAIRGGFFQKSRKQTKNKRMSELFRRLGRRSPEATVWPDRAHEHNNPTPTPTPKLPPPVQDDDDNTIPPPSKQLPLPPPVGDDAPALPAAAMAQLATGNPSISEIEAWAKKYLSGPVDARAALPWDGHEYPPTQPVPEEVIAIYDREEWITRKILAWWKSKGDERPDDMPDDTPQLPAIATKSSARNFTKKLLGPTPLERYDEYLQANGIRYFTAKELTSHNWFKATKKQTLKGVSAWQCFLEVIPPDSIIQFVMPQHVVPNPRLWPNIIPVLRILDRFRHWLRHPVRGVSGFRLPWYNTAISGSKTSFHMSNSAIDFAYTKFTPQGEMDVRIFYRFFDALYKLKGSGVGGYPQFCHVDYNQNRHRLRGKAVRWVHAARKNKDNIFHNGERYAIVGSKR